LPIGNGVAHFKDDRYGEQALAVEAQGLDA
jgi:hypothetical protein